MHLWIDGARNHFIERKAFLTKYNLPTDFSLRLFEPKDYTGLAAIDRAGAEMNALRNGMLDAVPTTISRAELLSVVDQLQAVFQAGLYGINEVIGLRVEEVEFAVAGFGDVLRNWAYALIATQQADFHQVYWDWMDSSVRLSHRVHRYVHQGQEWQVQIVNHAYGRAGLRIDTGQEVLYMQDGAYVCPAEGYMLTMLEELARKMQEALR